ncbi:MAG: metallophosphoesterase [Desulfuromonas sp.]|nr:MAG: metallophosphoesterase [Desulfuromonas sp.]
MTLFLLIFLSIYSAMHVLVFWGAHPLLKGHPALPTLTWVWMALMIFAPLLVRLSERAEYENLARALAWVSYSWMGVVFVAFSLFVLLGIWELFAAVISRLDVLSVDLSIRGGVTAFLAGVIVLGACFYGLYEANTLQIEQVRIVSDKLPADSTPIRIAQVSDMHLGLIHRDEALTPVVNRLRELRPDLLVATGDIVDAQINHLEELSSIWNQLDPPLGKFAVLGNHEYYAGLGQSIDFLKKSGFRILRNEAVAVGEVLRLAGVDDPARQGVSDDGAALSGASDRFTVFLKHRPLISDEAKGRFDLQLSGHSHRGQIFPFNLLTGLRFPMQDGLYTLEGGAHLYTSRGTGTWGPPMRIFSPPEITVIEIVSTESI